MAVIIQKIVGRSRDNRFYPDFSGVARSHNFYPTAPQKSEDGVSALSRVRSVAVKGATACTLARRCTSSKQACRDRHSAPIMTPEPISTQIAPSARRASSRPLRGSSVREAMALECSDGGSFAFDSCLTTRRRLQRSVAINKDVSSHRSARVRITQVFWGETALFADIFFIAHRVRVTTQPLRLCAGISPAIPRR